MIDHYLNKRVFIVGNRYNYLGTLVNINDECVVLKDANVIALSIGQKVKELIINRNSIEMVFEEEEK